MSNLYTPSHMRQTLLFFDGKGDQSNSSRILEEDEEIYKSGTTLDTEVSNFDEADHPINSEENESSFNSDNKELPFNATGVLMGIYLNICFYY